MNTPEFIKREDINGQEQYFCWLADVKKRVQQTRSKAIVQVNTAMLELYWSIGRDLVAMHPEYKWGKGIVKQFALEMRNAFPNETGFSDTNIKYMRRWVEFYTQSAAIGQQAADQMEMPVSFGRIPWFHHVLIFTKSATVDEAFFYIQQTIAGNWSRRLLEDNIQSDLYARQGQATTNIDTRLPATEVPLAQDMLKDPYIFDFLTMKECNEESISMQ